MNIELICKLLARWRHCIQINCRPLLHQSQIDVVAKVTVSSLPHIISHKDHLCFMDVQARHFVINFFIDIMMSNFFIDILLWYSIMSFEGHALFTQNGQHEIFGIIPYRIQHHYFLEHLKYCLLTSTVCRYYYSVLALLLIRLSPVVLRSDRVRVVIFH